MTEMASETTQTRVNEERRRLAELCLWLTEEEAQLLVTMCLGSGVHGGAAEQALFAKLGDYLRAFHEKRG